MQGAVFLTAQRMTVAVYMHKEVIGAIFAGNLGRRPSQNAFSGFAPEYDLAVTVRQIGAIGKDIENLGATNGCNGLRGKMFVQRTLPVWIV